MSSWREDVRGRRRESMRSLPTKDRDEGPNKNVGYLLPEKLIRRIKHEAVARDSNASRLVREILERYLSEQETSVPA
jgi:predicted DNA binding CopG/RHH family protein